MDPLAGLTPPVAPPRRKGLPGWLIVLLVIIPLAAVAAAGIFAVRSFHQKVSEVQKSVFVANVSSGNRAEVTKALDADPSLANAECSLGVSPLNAAASGGDLAMMKLLIARNADVNGREPGGLTPLHSAAVSNQAEAAKLLLANGAKVDAPTDTGNTPLHLAVIIDKEAVAEVLIAHGANVNAKANDGTTPLKAALKRLAKLNQLPPNAIKARKAQMGRAKKQGQSLLELDTPEHYQHIVNFLRQHGGKE